MVLHALHRSPLTEHQNGLLLMLLWLPIVPWPSIAPKASTTILKAMREVMSDNFHTTEAFLGHSIDELESFSRKQSAQLGPSSSRYKGSLDRGNSITQVHRTPPIPGQIEGHFDNLVDSVFFDIVLGENARFAFNPVGNRRTRYLPSSNSDLDQVLGPDIGNIGGVKVGRRGVHSLVHGHFLDCPRDGRRE
jgi:hypothetical protein